MMNEEDLAAHNKFQENMKQISESMSRIQSEYPDVFERSLKALDDPAVSEEDKTEIEKRLFSTLDAAQDLVSSIETLAKEMDIEVK